MATEYLLVTFPEARAVRADGVGVGFTNHIMMLPGDEYEITLDGNSCVPPSRVIALAGTSMVKPMVICFDLVATAAAMARNAVPAKPHATRGTRAPAKAIATLRKKTGSKPVAKRAKSVIAKPAAKVEKDA